MMRRLWISQALCKTEKRKWKRADAGISGEARVKKAEAEKAEAEKAERKKTEARRGLIAAAARLETICGDGKTSGAN